MRFLWYFILSIYLLSCNSKKESDFSFEFYNANRHLKRAVYIGEIKKIDWQKQCYYIDEELIKELGDLDLLDGKVNIVFKKKVLDVIHIISIYSSEVVWPYIPCRGTGEFLSGEYICIYTYTPINNNLLSDNYIDVHSVLKNNKELYNYFMKENLIK